MIAVLEQAPRIELNQVNAADWAEMLSQFDDATIYQTWAYGEVNWGASNVEHVVVRNGDEVRGIAQVRIIVAPLGAGVAYVRWAPLWKKRGEPANVSNFEQILFALKNEYATRRGLLLRVVPHIYSTEPEAVVACLQSNGFAKNDSLPCYRTFRVNLTPTLDEIRKRLDQKWRNCLNRAEKNGLTVREGESAELYDIFLHLYDEMYARKEFETSVDPRQFWKLQAKLAGCEKLHVLICEKDGVALSALVGSRIGNTCIYLLGATSSEGMKHKGSYLLQWRMLQWAKEGGCSYYDLGGINPEKNPGVYHFKEGLAGVDETMIGTYETCGRLHSRILVHAVEKLKRSFGRH